MRPARALCVVFAMTVPCTCALATSESAGALLNPLQFDPAVFVGMTPSIHRAVPFTLSGSGGYAIDEVEVAVSRYFSTTGSVATFAFWSDDAGRPGGPLAEFQVTGITTTPQILTVAAPSGTLLDAGTAYWLVGYTTDQQVKWHVNPTSIGQSAYRVLPAGWLLQSDVARSAFNLVGGPAPVPEPATGALLIALVLLARFQRAPQCARFVRRSA